MDVDIVGTRPDLIVVDEVGTHLTWPSNTKVRIGVTKESIREHFNQQYLTKPEITKKKRVYIFCNGGNLANTLASTLGYGRGDWVYVSSLDMLRGIEKCQTIILYDDAYIKYGAELFSLMKAAQMCTLYMNDVVN